MNILNLTFIALTVLMAAACHSTKKSPTATVAPVPVPAKTTIAVTTATVSTDVPLVVKPASGVYPPGEEELTAIRAHYNEVTLDKLKEGYAIYTEGACVGCHRALNIYVNGEAKWKTIIDDMAQRAELSAEQKDAVYKYVLAIKAAQPKGAN